MSLFDDLKDFADGDGSSFVSESKSTELRKSFECFHTNGLSSCDQFESGDADLILFDESRMFLSSISRLSIDQRD